MVTIEAISDTHNNRHLNIKLKGADILVHAGDISNYGSYSEVKSFLDWFESLKNYKYKIFIAGNHDLSFEDKHEWLEELLAKTSSNVIYLEDRAVKLLGLKFYGTPWCPSFGDWAFMDNENNLDTIFKCIPKDTDVLISHTPPFGVMDINRYGSNCGSQSILNNSYNVKLHIFGHIHESYGVKEVGNKVYCNASTYKVDYNTEDLNKSILLTINDDYKIDYSV